MSVAVLARTADPGRTGRPVASYHPSMVSRPVLQFAVSGLLALMFVGIGAFFVLRSQGDAESVRDARRLTRILGTTAIEPALTDSLVRGDPAAIARLDRLVRDRVVVDPVVRVKLWTPDGQIVYSDEKRLIGSRYSLSAEDRASFTRNKVDAEISDLGRPGEPIREAVSQAPRGLPPGAHARRKAPPVRVLHPLQRGLGDGPACLASVPADPHRRSRGSLGRSDPARGQAGAAAAGTPARARRVARARDRGLGHRTPPDRRRPP